MDITELSEHPEAIDEMGREELLEAEGLLKEAISGYANSSKDHDRTAEDRKADLEAAQEGTERRASVRARLEALAVSDAERDAEADKILEAIAEPEEEVEETPEAEAEEPEAEPEVEAPEAEVEEVEEEPALAASAKPSIARMAKRAPKLPDPKPALVASAGPMVHSQYPNGFHNPSELGAAAMKAWQSYGSQKVDQTSVIASGPPGPGSTSSVRFTV